MSRERPIEVERLIGLADFCLRTGDLDRARRALELAASLALDPLRLHLAQGRLSILEGDRDGAIGHLRTARDIDPFDEAAADLLGRLLADTDDRDEALDCLLDAQVLGGAGDEDSARSYDEAIDAVRAKLDLDGDAFQQRKLERMQWLEQAGLEAEEFAEAPDLGPQPVTQAAPGVPMRDVLRHVAPFTQLDEAELRLLECAVDRLRVPAGQAVFREGQPSEDLYVVESGKILIQRETPFGQQVLATVASDRLFGEMNFIDGRTRSADAVAADDAILLRISHAGLREIFSVEPKLALTFMKEFWRGLADKVREGNELMKTFFKEDDKGASGQRKDKAKAVGKSATVGAQAKADVLQEKGLNANELKVLAGYAQAQGYDVEAAIFREGDSGQSLYIVLEGRVRIEKHIPGVGQEALAILERGEFFGEMAILDLAERSASAIAHESGTTVLELEKKEIDALLERGGEGAHELLRILCRLLSQRLREINDKIVQWRMMSGGF